MKGGRGESVEFGAKVNNILVDGISFIEKLSFNAFNEGTRLIHCLKMHKRLFGVEAKKVGGDTGYAGTDNRDYFMREDGSVNEQELLDTEKPLVHVDGNLGQDSIRPIDYNALPGNYINVWSTMVNELRETSGNTDTAAGNVTSGVTAASAIAALQEASGKGSRDST